MRVAWAIPCRYVEVQPQGGATLVGAGADVYWVPEIPAPVQMLFAVRFVGDPSELDGTAEHRIACRLFDPDGKALGEQGGQFTGDVTMAVPGYLAELTIPMAVVIDARQFGTHHVEFEIDGDSLRVPVHIVQGPPPGQS
jgi:hypothetical protein